MPKFKRRHRHSLPFGLFLAVAGALLLPAALAPRANAGSTDYWDSELFQPQGVLINQPLASNYNSNLALNVAPGGQPGAFQPSGATGGGGLLAPDATIVWGGGAGGNANIWNRPQNWGGNTQPTINDTAQFDNTAIAGNLAPSIGATATSVGAILFAAGTTNAYNISGTATLTLGSATVSGITNASATNQQFSVTNIALGVSQTWNVQSTGNLSLSSNVALGGNGLTLDGSSTGQGTISGVISGAGAVTKTGTGTWITTGNNSYTGGTTVNSGTLLVNGGDLGTGNITVNSGGTLGGTSGSNFTSGNVTVAAGGNLSPGNGGNNTANIQPSNNLLTLAPGSNFRVDLNGTTVGTQYDHIDGSGGGTSGLVIAGSNLVVHIGFAVTTAQTFTIVHNGGGFGGQQFASGTSVIADDGKVFSITYTGDNIILQWTGTIIPEPSTYIGGALAIAGLAFTQRRRLRKLIARRCAVDS